MLSEAERERGEMRQDISTAPPGDGWAAKEGVSTFCIHSLGLSALTLCAGKKKVSNRKADSIPKRLGAL